MPSQARPDRRRRQDLLEEIDQIVADRAVLVVLSYPVHAAAEEGIPFRSIAEAIGRGLGLPAKSITPEQAPDLLGGFIGLIVQLDNQTSSARTRELLGWKPTDPDLLDDIAAGHYLQP